jgi:uncharacterized protein YndB with AHSA1/START domain
MSEKVAAREYGEVIGEGAVRFERLLPGPIERVWSYLTDSEKRGTWLAIGEMEQRVGGRVEHLFRNSDLAGVDDPPPEKYKDFVESRMSGEVLECEPPRLLRYSWDEPNSSPSEVTFELSSRGDRVLLVLTHRRLSTRDEMIGVAGGWHTHLGILAARLEGHEPPAFWPTHMRLESEYEVMIPVG